MEYSIQSNKVDTVKEKKLATETDTRPEEVSKKVRYI